VDDENVKNKINANAEEKKGKMLGGKEMEGGESE